MFRICLLFDRTGIVCQVSGTITEKIFYNLEALQLDNWNKCSGNPKDVCHMLYRCLTND